MSIRKKSHKEIQIERDFEQAVYLHTARRLTDAVTAFRAILRQSPAHFGALHRLGVICREQGDMDEALAFLERAIHVNPHSADARNSLGNTLQALGRDDDAIVAFQGALAVRPAYPAALNNLGNSRRAIGRLDDAEACFRQSIALEPRYEAAYSNLANILLQLQRPEEALQCLQTALALNPGLAAAHNNRGNALMALNRHGEAETAFARACELAPGLREPRLNQGFARLSLGEYASGWLGFESRPALAAPARFAHPRWDGRSDLAGKSLLVHYEQGFGDTIQFARYLPFVAQPDAQIILEVQRPLARLMATLSCPLTIIAAGDPLPEFDLHIPLLSLPFALGTTLDTIPADIPYLKAAGEPSGRIGLCWAGNPVNPNDRNRSIPLPILSPVLDVPGARFVSLQRDLRSGDEDILAQYSNIDGVSCHAWQDFADTAAAVAGMDLVITADTAVAHLAGALGIPVWLLLTYSAHWVWLREREDSPWYPTTRLFRQTHLGDWNGVAACVAAALTERLSVAPAG